MSDKSKKFLEEEFRRLCKKGRSHLVLHELLNFRPQGNTLPVDLCHLGVLWVLDKCVYLTANFVRIWYNLVYMQES